MVSTLMWPHRSDKTPLTAWKALGSEFAVTPQGGARIQRNERRVLSRVVSGTGMVNITDG
jgi:hypothetical protein